MSAPYAVQVGALVSEELLRLLSETYDHRFPISSDATMADVFQKSGEAEVLQFLKHARKQFLEHSTHRALVNPS